MSNSLSAMARRIQPSATLALGAKAKQLRVEGRRIYDFCLGEPDFPTPEHICQAAIKAMQLGFTKYTPANGTPELRAAIARTYQQRYGVDYPIEQVVVCNGAKHAIHNALSALVGPGDEVLIPSPYWVSYRDMVDMTGATFVPVPTVQTNHFKMTPAQFRAALTPRTRILLFNSPCNPTGGVYSQQELNALAEVVLDAKLTVVSDEIYERLTFGGVKHHSFASLRPELRDCTVTISGASKSYAMTGWRMGWATGPAAVIKAMGDIQSQQTGCPNSVSQYAALAGLEGDQACVEKMRREFEARRDLVIGRLAAMPDITCTRADGAFYAFFHVGSHFGRTLGGRVVRSSAEFCQMLLDVHGLALVPGSSFGADAYLRLSFAAHRDELTGGLDQLEKALKA